MVDRRVMNGEVRVVVFRGDGPYLVAQCLEYDIAAQGKSYEELVKRFEATMVGYIMLALEHGDVPFAKLERAPETYWMQWEKASRVGKMKNVLELRLPNSAKSKASRAPQRAELALA